MSKLIYRQYDYSWSFEKQRGYLSYPLPWEEQFCFFCWQNKPMKLEIEEFCFRQVKSAWAVGDVIPGGRYRQLLYPVNGVYRSWNWRSSWASPINTSTRIGIFKCEELTSFTRVENLIILPLGVFKDSITTSFVCLTLKFLFPCWKRNWTSLACEDNRPQ